MPPITAFRDAYFFLSNFSESPIVFDGQSYPTVEHAFQAAKTFDLEQRKLIQEATTPATAKRLGRAVALRADWEQVKFDIMHALLKQKFERPDLRQALLATGDAELIEGNTWNDRTWGRVLVKGQWIGKNRLGELLMRVRAETPPLA
jgi:ribA/ribD-fused uncharacterized protein